MNEDTASSPAELMVAAAAEAIREVILDGQPMGPYEADITTWFPEARAALSAALLSPAFKEALAGLLEDVMAAHSPSEWAADDFVSLLLGGSDA